MRICALPATPNIANVMVGKHVYGLVGARFVVAGVTVDKGGRSARIGFFSGVLPRIYLCCLLSKGVSNRRPGEQLANLMFFVFGQSNTSKRADLVQSTLVLL